MSNLIKTGAIHPNWTRTADPTLDSFAAVDIVLLDMKLGEDGQGYDWRTNQGGYSEPEVLYSGPSSLDLYRLTLTMDDVAGSTSQFRNARFLINQNDYAGFIGKGMTIRVTRSNENPWLLGYEFVVVSGINGGLAFRRIVETEVNTASDIAPWGQ